MTKRNDYILDNLHLAKNMAYRMNGKHQRANYDDVLSYANLGLIQAADTYETDRGSSFKTYAYRCIKGAIIDGLRQEKVIVRIRRKDYQGRNQESVPASLNIKTPLKGLDGIYLKPNQLVSRQTVSFDAHEGVEIGENESLFDPVENRIENKQKRKVVLKAMSNLPFKMRRLLIMHYFKNKTLKEAGATMNLSKSWASRLHERAIMRLSENEGLRMAA